MKNNNKKNNLENIEVIEEKVAFQRRGGKYLTLYIYDGYWTTTPLRQKIIEGGELYCYTNGFKVASKSNLFIENGDLLIPKELEVIEFQNNQFLIILKENPFKIILFKNFEFLNKNNEKAEGLLPIIIDNSNGYLKKQKVNQLLADTGRLEYLVEDYFINSDPRVLADIHSESQFGFSVKRKPDNISVLNLSNKLEFLGKRNGIPTIITSTEGKSFLVIDTEIRINLLNHLSGGSSMVYFMADDRGKINEKKSIFCCSKTEKIEPFTFKEGMIQSIHYLNGDRGLSFMTLRGETYSIPSVPSVARRSSAEELLNKSQIIEKIGSLFNENSHFSYKEIKADEDNINVFNLLISPKKPGRFFMNGIAIKGKTLNGETTTVRYNKNICYKDFCLKMEKAEWDRMLLKRTFIAQMKFEHPRVGSYKTQYFKSGMIGLKIPDGSLIMKDEIGRYNEDEIMTPSGKIYGFSSWGSGCHSGYSVDFKHYASEDEKKIYFEKGYPVKGMTTIDKSFGVTNSSPLEID